MRFPGKEANKLYFTADTHFCHRHIMDYCTQPFKSIEEHDEVLIENWKKTVPEDGIVFHLGDVGFGLSTRLREIIDDLPGKMYLVVGNHDLRHLDVIKSRFEKIFWQVSLELGKRYVVLNHYPFLCYAGTYKHKHNTYQLFGHVHSGPNSTTGLDIPRLVNLFPWQYDVGVDNNNFAPVSWLAIQTVMEKRRQDITAKSGS